MLDQYYNVLLFCNPWDKVLILVTSRGQICLIVFHFFKDFVPIIEEEGYTGLFVQHFLINPDTFGNGGKSLNNI